MEIEKVKASIEAILFACGREVEAKELMSALELSSEDLMAIIESMKEDYEKQNRGIEIIKVQNAFQLTTKKEYYEYIYPIFDKRSKPNLSNAALEVLAIIAYNPNITKAEIEAIRGVSSDGTMYKLLEYNLIENVGKADLPGRPGMYCVTKDFLKMFGLTNLDELPQLPKYKLDENRQIVIDDILEAPMPERDNVEREEQEKQNRQEGAEEQEEQEKQEEQKEIEGQE